MKFLKKKGKIKGILVGAGTALWGGGGGGGLRGVMRCNDDIRIDIVCYCTPSQGEII